jgi:probable F420-dependent oxidoreductase
MLIGVNIANHRDLLSRQYIHNTARLSEELGFDSVWIPDHILVPSAVAQRYGPVYYDALAVLAYLAGITSRVRLGTTVLVIPYRHPIVLAKELASIDQLSDGRLILGVGVGWAEAEFQILNLPFAERGRRTDESLRLMQTLWSQEAPRFEGTYYTFANVPFDFQPKPVQNPLPVWIGGNGSTALRRTAEFGTAWHPIDQPPTRLQSGLDTLSALCQQRGQTVPELCPRFTVRLHRDRMPDDSRQFMEGTAAQITDDLLRVKALGATHVVLSTQTNDRSQFRWEIETLAARVLPHIR